MITSVMLGIIFLAILFCFPCSAVLSSSADERIDNLELRVSRLDFSTNTKYLDLKNKIRNLNVQGGSGTQGPNTSTIESKLKSYDEKMETFVTEQQERSNVIARAVSEEKVITREIINIVKDLSESNAQSVLEIEENLQLSENEREQFKTDWIKFQDEMRTEIKKLSTKVEDLQNTLANFDGNVILNVGGKVKPCDEGWIQKNGVCYLYEQELKLAWLVASIMCSDVGGKLAEPDTDDKYEAVLDVINSGSNVWLGGSDNVKEGTWLWEYNETPVDREHWEANQPNNQGGNQNCLEIGVRSKLNDDRCNVKNKYVCEKPVNQ